MSKQYFSFSDATTSQKREVVSGEGSKKITVKFMHRGLRRGGSIAGFLRQFPGGVPGWKNCNFVFDVDCKEYDWLVVYHDLPRDDGYFTEEKLHCPRERTMLITGEPSTITVFGSDYLRQFGYILTFQEPWAMKHPHCIYHHPGLIWHYGLPFGDGEFIGYDQLVATPPPSKTKSISTVCSERTGNVTLHSTRVDFTWRLKGELPELDIYGHGVNPMDDKAEALDQYRYHIAVENHVYQHHLTEKLPDAFLGYTMPFYHGAPNACDYFPKESFVHIDINDYERARDIIRSHIANNEYEDRLPYIIEARRRVLEEQNLFAIIDNKISTKDPEITRETHGCVIRNRSTLRLKNPVVGVRSLSQKAMTKLYHRVTFKSRNKPRDF